MIAVPITANPDAPVGRPQVLVTGQYQRTDLPHYDVMPDGRRFVMIRPPEDDLDRRTVRILTGCVNELESADRPSHR